MLTNAEMRLSLDADIERQVLLRAVTAGRHWDSSHIVHDQNTCRRRETATQLAERPHQAPAMFRPRNAAGVITMPPSTSTPNFRAVTSLLSQATKHPRLMPNTSVSMSRHLCWDLQRPSRRHPTTRLCLLPRDRLSSGPPRLLLQTARSICCMAAMVRRHSSQVASTGCLLL